MGALSAFIAGQGWRRGSVGGRQPLVFERRALGCPQRGPVAGLARTVRAVRIRRTAGSGAGRKKACGCAYSRPCRTRTWTGPCSIRPACGPTNTRPGKKSSAPAEGLGRSRGGFTSKLHVVVDALGNPLRLRVTSGQQADCTAAADLLAGLAVGAVLADKAYDTNALVSGIAQTGAAVVVPSKRSWRVAQPLDRNLYADRNKVERFFNRLKQYRRLATRYEKTAVSFLAFAHCAATLIWLL